MMYELTSSSLTKSCWLEMPVSDVLSTVAFDLLFKEQLSECIVVFKSQRGQDSLTPDDDDDDDDNRVD